MSKERIKIEYSKNGVPQEVLMEFIDGVLVNKDFYPLWGEKVDISHLKTKDEAFNFIKEFSYGKRARITEVNGVNITHEWSFNHTHIQTLTNEIDAIIIDKLMVFLKEFVFPIMKKRKWYFDESWIGYLVIGNKKTMNNVNSSDEDYMLINNSIEYFFNQLDIRDKNCSYLSRYFKKDDINKNIYPLSYSKLNLAD